jgi:adenylate cyclase
MWSDDTGTLAALRDHQAELIDGKISDHGGGIVKSMGDGLLVEFSSVVDAVRSMISVQKGIAACNAEVPEGRRIILRIGVNLGDIIIDGDDIHRNGVNLAARLQAESEAGWIAISNTVNGQIKNCLDVSFRDDGEHTVKNIAQPVRIWRWAPECYVAPTTTSAPDKPSIAVLPFDNMSGDQEQEYFSDGMTEDIITDLSKASSLLVIARNSSFAYIRAEPRYPSGLP